VLETALDEELTEHLGHERRAPAAAGNVRNGSRSKSVLTEASGHVEIDVPRDRAGTFEPQIVRKRQRRLSGVDEIVLSLYAKGLTTGEISAHYAEIYGASVSKETVSRITDRVLEEMADWAVRPLDEVYAAVFVDAIVVKVRDGQVANRPIYAEIGAIAYMIPCGRPRGPAVRDQVTSSLITINGVPRCPRPGHHHHPEGDRPEWALRSRA
jgi:transposase-like protein